MRRKASKEASKQKAHDKKLAEYVRGLQTKGLTSNQISERVFQRFGQIVYRVNDDEIVMRGIKGKEYAVKLKNPRYLVTAKQKVTKDVDLGILEDESAKKALARAKTIYKGRGYTGMKARKRNPKQKTSKGREALRTTGRALKGATRGILSAGSEILGAGAKALNPDYHYWNVYLLGKTDSGFPTKTFVGASAFGVTKAEAIEKFRRTHYPGRLRAGQKLIAEKAIISKNPRKRKSNRTVIKAGRIDHLDVSKVHNPKKRLKVRNKYIDLVIYGQAKKTPQGWKVGGKTFAQGKGTVKVSSSYYLDKATGFVYAKRERNPSKGARYTRSIPKTDRSKIAAIVRAYRSGKLSYQDAKSKLRAFDDKYRQERGITEASDIFDQLFGVPQVTMVIDRFPVRKRKNIAQGFYDGSGIFHPIRASEDYVEGQRPSRRKSAKAKVRKASSSARTRSKVASRKATTSRLAGKSLSKSAGMLKKRRNSGKVKYYRLGIPPLQLIKPGIVFTDRKQASDYAKQENKYGDYRGRGVKVYEVDSSGQIKSKKNPSPASIRKSFAGRLGKGADLYFPDGTPQGLAKLGKLVSITTEEGTIKPVSGTAWLCSDTRGKLHIGSPSTNPLFAGPARSFGEVTKIEYEESKPHLGYKNPVIWFHKMGEETGEKPTLHSDGKGGLKFRGGAYKIESRGIVN
jgi:hypothetical protein